MGLFADFKDALREQVRGMGGGHPDPNRSPKPASKKDSAPVVRVLYVNTYESVPTITVEQSGGWAYYWRIKQAPRLGLRVLAPVGSGSMEEGVVIGFGRDDGYTGRLKSITRLK